MGGGQSKVRVVVSKEKLVKIRKEDPTTEYTFGKTLGQGKFIHHSPYRFIRRSQTSNS
jgi:hypothetical protein